MRIYRVYHLSTSVFGFGIVLAVQGFRRRDLS